MSLLFHPTLQDPVRTDSAGDATVGDVPAQGATDGSGAAPPAWSLFGGSMMPLLLIVVIFWVLVIMPQGKERKKRAKMLEALAKDDQVMTNGGLYGRVAKVDGDVVTLLVADGVRLRFHKQAIQTVLEGERTSSEAPSEGGRN